VTKLARGNVHSVALDPVIGSELRKTRPCVIVSPDEMNESLRTVIVAPLTSKGFAAPFRVDVPMGRVLCEQIRAVDRSRVREFFFSLDAEGLQTVLRVLREVFAD